MKVLFLSEASAAHLHAQLGRPGVINVVRIDGRFDKLAPSNVKIEKIPGGLGWDEVAKKKIVFSLMANATRGRRILSVDVGI